MVTWGIAITTYNREDIWERSVKSLAKTEFLPHTKIRIFDDASNSSKNINLAEKYLSGQDLVILRNTNTVGSKENYRRVISSFSGSTAVDVIINLDSDAIYSPLWQKELDKLMKIFNYSVLANVFFVRHHIGNPSNKLVDYGDYYERDSLNGLGLSFPGYIAQDFQIMNYPGHMDSYISFSLSKKYNLRSVCTKKSYIEHIGDYGVHSRSGYTDKATDFVGEE